jgi:predicted ATPase
LLGELAPSREHNEQAMALYDPQQHHSLAVLYGQDPQVSSLAAAGTLWQLGYPDQALKRSQEAVTLARALSHPFSLAFALNLAAETHQRLREGQLAQARAEAATTLSTDQGFAHLLLWGNILRGWALAEQGQGEVGVAQIRQGLDAWRAAGAEIERPHFLALLAEAYGKMGQTEEGLTVLAEALTQVEKTGERYYEAELYRLKGELTLQKSQASGAKFQVESGSGFGVQSPESEAEACFQKAIEIAQRQQAKSWELRAVMSLSRLWQNQGKKDEARQLLAEIYGWFTEGFDTKDLQEAKALLQELT